MAFWSDPDGATVEAAKTGLEIGELAIGGEGVGVIFFVGRFDEFDASASCDRVGTGLVAESASAGVVAIENETLQRGAVERRHRALEDEAVALVAERELGGLRGEFAIEYGCDGDDGKHNAGDDGDAKRAERSDLDGAGDVAGERRGDERDCGHAGVVHRCDGKAHHDRTGDFGRAKFADHGAQTEGDQQRGHRNNDRDQNRRDDDARIVAADCGEAHRRHTDVVHGCDSRAHDDAGRDNGACAHVVAADKQECDGGGENRGQE